MYLTHSSPRRSLARIHAAIQAGLGHAYTEGGEGAGGADDPPAKPEKKAKEKTPDPDTLTMTIAERDKLITDALADQQRKADTKAAKDKADREAEEAKKRGEFEKVAETEKAGREAAEVERDGLKLTLALRDHIAEHKPEFIKAAALIGKLIDREAAKEDADKAIKAAISEYEGTLPEKPKGSAAAPPSQNRQASRVASPVNPQNNDRPARRFSTLNYRV